VSAFAKEGNPQESLMNQKIKDWSAYLKEKEDTVLVEDIRKSTKTGRPCGDDRFVMKMEKLLGRKLTALPKGRPRKTK
jgi:putative transposase